MDDDEEVDYKEKLVQRSWSKDKTSSNKNN